MAEANKFGIAVVAELPKSTRGTGAAIEWMEEVAKALIANPNQWLYLGQFNPSTAAARKNKIVTTSTKFGLVGEVDCKTRGTETPVKDDAGADTDKMEVAVYAKFTPEREEVEDVKVERKGKGSKATA